MLLPALALALLDLTFPRLLVYERGYRTIKETVIVMGNWTSPNVHSFGQANEEMIVTAIVLALLYLICCFIAIKRVPKEEKKRRQSRRRVALSKKLLNFYLLPFTQRVFGVN